MPLCRFYVYVAIGIVGSYEWDNEDAESLKKEKKKPGLTLYCCLYFGQKFARRGKYEILILSVIQAPSYILNNSVMNWIFVELAHRDKSYVFLLGLHKFHFPHNLMNFSLANAKLRLDLRTCYISIYPRSLNIGYNKARYNFVVDSKF